MNPQRQIAYNLGAQNALAVFQKHAAEERLPWGEGSQAGDVLTPALGSIPLFGAPLAGLVSGKTTPLSPGGVGAMTTAGSATGQAAGGLGGAALGAGLGSLAGLLAQKYKPEWELGPGRAAGIGALLGGGIGTMAGGAYGAHRGRQVTEEAAKREVTEEMMERLQRQENRAAQNEAALQAILQARTMGRREGLQYQEPPRQFQHEGEPPQRQYQHRPTSARQFEQ